MNELLADVTWQNLLWIVGVSVGVGFIPIYALSWIFEFFVGLKSPPTKRAALTVGLAYVITAISFIWLAPNNYVLLAAIAPIPGAVAWYIFTRSHYKRAWYENAEDLPEGTKLANDNWKHGLLYLALAIIIIIGIGLFRVIRDGMVASL